MKLTVEMEKMCFEDELSDIDTRLLCFSDDVRDADDDNSYEVNYFTDASPAYPVELY